MSKPEVQTTISDISCGSEILSLLLRGHGAPNAVALLVPPDVVELRSGVKDQQIDAADDDEHPVAPPVARCVIRPVNIC